MKIATAQRKFANIVKFMEFLMALPHSSAAAERQFSFLKQLKTPLRNVNPDTNSALIHTNQFIVGTSY